MIILSSTEQQQLITQANLKDLSTNDYLINRQNDNLKVIANLFFNGSIDKALTYNVGSNIFMSITDVYSFFIGQATMDIGIDISEVAKDLISVGKGIIALGIQNNEYTPEYIPASNYIYSNGEHKVIRYYTGISNDERKYYLLKQVYRVGEIENILFEISTLESTSGVRVPLDTIPQTSGLKDIYKTGIDRVNLFIVDEGALYGSKQSLIDKIKNLGYSLDRKQVMFETQFLQETEQFKIFENIQIDPKLRDTDGKVNFNSIGKNVATTPGEKGDIKFISNKNDLIQDAINYEQTQLRKVSSSTFIPLDFLGIQDGGAISGTSREIMMSAFVKSVEAKQNLIQKNILEPILDIMIQNRQKVNGELMTKQIYWEDVISKNSKELAEELKIARETGIISQYTAVKSYMGYNTDAQIQEEINLINNELNNENNGSESQPNQE